MGLSRSQLGEKLGINQNSIGLFERDKQLPSEPILKLLEYLFRLNREFVLEGKGDLFLSGEASREKGEELHEFLVREAGWPPPYGTRRPVEDRDWITFQRATAPGPGGQVLESDQLVDHIAFRRGWIRARLGGRAADLVLVETAGDSMEPTIRAGDLALVDTDQHRIREAGLYCLVEGPDLSIRRVQRVPGQVVIRPDNPAYHPVTLTGPRAAELPVLGRVVWLGRIL
ncbi:MAG: hypothetical protein GWM98_13600 [Nitrospinaceae bacterium]|nr:hypothetical protein [Nitrospinaceae bacterium]